MNNRKSSVYQKQRIHISENNEVKPGVLAKYFPMIRTRQEILNIIDENSQLSDVFYNWKTSAQQEFLDFCSGMKGMKILYDGFFKEIFNPEVTPHRLEILLSLILERHVSIKTVLTNDSVRLGAETSLLYTDIIVQLEDGSLADIEIQKIGYAFPGERCACYSADHLLRQYKRVKESTNGVFTYRNIKQVYTIVFIEKSTGNFHQYPDNWLHRFKQRSDTGLELELLQEYYFIPLDIFKKNIENKDIQEGLEAWLTFLSCDDPEFIETLIIRFPEFKAMYQDVYELCLNTEKVMEMYSKELQMLDENTVRYMIDELQADLDRERQERAKEQAEMREVREELQKDKEELQKDKEELQKDKEELKKGKEELQTKFDQEKQNAVRAREELSRSQEQIHKLEEQLRANGIDPMI